MTGAQKAALTAAAVLFALLGVIMRPAAVAREATALEAAETAITEAEAVVAATEGRVVDRQVHIELANAASMARGVVDMYGTPYGETITVDALEAIPGDLAEHIGVAVEDHARFEATPRGPDARLAAEGLAAGYGYTVEWVETTPAGYTGTVADPDEIWVAGYYDTAEPDTLLLSVGWHDPDLVPTAYEVVATVKGVAAHEVAHGEIWRTCGTTAPPIAGDDSERVTDAYAAEVLGVAPSRSMYGDYSHRHAEAALRIAEGECE